MIPIRVDGAAISFRVRVIPRARRSEISGVRGEALLVRLAAPPLDGAANDALVALLASTLERPARDVAIISGLSARDKRVAVSGLTEAALTARLFTILPR